MGWLSDMFEGVKASDFVQPIMSVIAGQRTTAANARAADMVQQANRAAADRVIAANAAAAERLAQGNQAAIAEFQRTRTAAAPGMAHLSGIVAGYQPGVMTPAQAEQLRQQRMEMAARLTRGLGGRSAVAAADDLTRRTTATFDAQNQQRADAAAGSLASTGNAATNAIANVNASGGAGAANLIARTGSDVGRLISDAGTTAANATTANAGVDAATLGGALQSVFARDRAEERKSRYLEPKM